MYTLVFLLADSDFIFFNEDTDGINQAVITDIKAQIYVESDKVDEFCERMIGSQFGGYLVPSEYTGDLVLTLPETCEVLPEYPKDFNWGFIEDCLPDYYSANEVLESDLLQRYVDNELDDGEEGRQKDLDWVEADCPEYLTKKEWAHHKLAETDTYLYNLI